MSEETLNSGDTIGKYKIEDEIGRGAIGVVYKAHDPSIDRKVAIKTLHNKFVNDDQGADLKSRFQQEAKAAARCAHSNILTIYEYAEHDGVPFIAMEYVQGEELKKFLKDFIRFKIQDIVVIIQQILSGLKFAHSQQVIHRDIKPANIILLKRKQIKITDFGVARIEDDSSDSVTESSVMTGTPNYMSPEQLATEAVDNRTDLYSVGLILFELLSRAKTNTSNGKNKPRGYHVRDEVELSIEWLKEYIPHEFVTVIFTALQKTPDNRYQNAAQFSTAILKAYKAYLIANEEVTPSAAATKKAAKARQTIANSTVTPTPKNSPPVTTEKAAKSSSQESPQAFQWSEDILGKLEINLAEYIGPFAKVLVIQNSRQYHSITRFIEALATKIPDEADKNTFVSTVNKLCGGTIPNVDSDEESLSDDNENDGVTAIFDNSVLHETEKELAYFVGPIAKALVLKEANNSSSRGDLYRKLSHYIPVEDERSEFLNKVAN